MSNTLLLATTAARTSECLVGIVYGAEHYNKYVEVLYICKIRICIVCGEKCLNPIQLHYVWYVCA